MCEPEPIPGEGAISPEWAGELPDDAVIVRGGLMGYESLTISAKRHYAQHGVYALSFWSYPAMNAQEIAVEVGNVAAERSEIEGHEIVLLPNAQMRQATVEALRAAGYDVTPGGGFRGHVTLVLGELPTDTGWDSLVNCFQAEEPNPIARKG